MKNIIAYAGILIMLFQAIIPLPVFADTSAELQHLIRGLEVGEPVTYENLTIFPIYNTLRARHLIAPGAQFGYLTLDEAMENNYLSVAEISGGSVPQVKVTNRSDKFIFMMGGEIITGCKQDRLIARDVLLRPRAKEVIVPVYCVEHGRWNQQSDVFYSKRNLGTYELRAEAQKAGADAQQKIWSRVSSLHSDNKVASTTGAYQETYDNQEVKSKIDIYEKEMARVPNLYPDSIGVVIAVGGRIVNVDIFENSRTFLKLWPKLLKSSALAAINSYSDYSVTQKDAAEFLRRVYNKDYAHRNGIDAGVEYQAADNDGNVNALVYSGAVIHLASFTQKPLVDVEKDRTPGHEYRYPVMRQNIIID